MSLLKNFIGLFRSKGTLHVPTGSFRFLGEPTGEVDVLKDVLREAIRHDHGLKAAYLAQISFANNEKTRLALCLDTDSPARAVIGPLSRHCAKKISSIDILFFSDLPQNHIDTLKSLVKPFWGSDRYP